MPLNIKILRIYSCRGYARKLIIELYNYLFIIFWIHGFNGGDCEQCVYLCFYRLHLQGRRLTKGINQQKLREVCLPPASADLLLRLIFHPEDGDDIFHRNVWDSPIYTALKPNCLYCLSVKFFAFSIEAYKGTYRNKHELPKEETMPFTSSSFNPTVPSLSQALGAPHACALRYI
jgi:hypothetical protein